MTREKYETLPLSELKELAKFRGLKGCSTLRKSEIIDRMLAEDEKIKAEEDKKRAEASAAAAEKPEKAPEEKKPAKRGRPAGSSAAKKTVSAKKQEKTAARADKNAAAAPADIKEKNDAGKEAVQPVKEAAPAGKEEPSAKKRASASDKKPRLRKNAVKTEEPSVKEPVYESVAEKSADYSSEQDAEPAVQGAEQNRQPEKDKEGDKREQSKLDSGNTVEGILEVMSEGFGFIRSDNFLPGDDDVYVSPSQIRRFGLKTGDILKGNTRIKMQNEKFSALLYVNTVNGLSVSEITRRANFEDLTPIFPNERIRLERQGSSVAMRIVDLLSPIGKGQRGMIVSPPKAGKTTLLKEMAMSILHNNPEMHIIILLIDERPEEVTDMKETVYGPNVEVIYSTFDELPDHHRRVSEMVIERAKRLVESKRDVIIFIDSITRLARAYNQVVQSSGRTLSGGLDPSALHMPKRFFGAARNIREGGSLTILATALVDTGSKMDDVVYEEFKGTGNMELVLDRKLQERRIFPAIDIVKSGTRREDLLLDRDELETINRMRRALNGVRGEEATENILNMFVHTRNNPELIRIIQKQKTL